MKNGGKMSNSVYLFKVGKGNVVLRGYSTDKDLMHAVNDIERVLMHLSHSSVYDVIKELSPYRERLAKGENWGGRKMRALTDGKTKIGAQLFPDRKRPAICVQKGNKIKIYGYFQNVETALEFMHELAILVKAEEE